MGNGNAKGLSINAKTLILILLFVNIGFAVKMIHKYYVMKDAGYIREKTFQEQVKQKVLKSFGSVAEMNKVVTDIMRQKDEAEKTAASIKEQETHLKLVNAQLEQTKAQLEEEKAKLQKEIWSLEDELGRKK
jgi:septal ring factor EnvC (AmiA/AmiB activator)